MGAQPLPLVAPAFQGQANLSRLRLLVEAAEKALAAGDGDAAFDRCDEAEVLIADWSPQALSSPETLALLDRLRAVLREVSEEVPDESAGKSGVLAGGSNPLLQEEVITLSGEELKAELERVKAAEEGSQYDFPIDLNDKVLTMVHTFATTKRGFVENALGRASRFLPMVRQVFGEEGIPQDLAYLAVIESGFRNQAKSRAAAVGMWQFMRSTGRIFGLNGNSWIEERRDPVKATRAAARYLKRLHQISGDWYLALVGYNAGPLTVERAVQALDSRNFWDLYRSRYLRNETKNYVPSLCAAILVAKNPERFGFNIPPQPPYAFETVEVDRMTSLAVLARFAGTDVDSLKDLNPELLRGTTPPGRYVLKVPPGASGTLNRALTRIPNADRLDFRRYVLRKGDTPELVAARFKLSAQELLSVNELSRAQFRPGRRIQVPPPAPLAIDDRDLLTQEDRNRIMGEQPLATLPVIPGQTATPSLSLMAETQPSPGAISRTGVPAPAPASTMVAAAPAPPAPAAPPSIEAPPPSSQALPQALDPQPLAARRASPVTRTTVATTGATVASIARDFAVPIQELLRLNPDLARGMKPGDAIRLPDLGASPAVPSPAGAVPLAPAPEKWHIVRRGETLFSISQRYGVTPEQMRKWNGLKRNAIHRGQRLWVSPR